MKRSRPDSCIEALTDAAEALARAQAVLSPEPQSIPPAKYRWDILEDANIRFAWSEPLPLDIRQQIHQIFEYSPSQERLSARSRIAQKLCDESTRVLQGAKGEDKCIEPLCTALGSMDYGILELSRKIDFEHHLKPKLHQYSGPTKFLKSSQIGTKAPSSAQSDSQTYHVKTPQPAVTIGFSHRTLVEEISEIGPSQVEIDKFLRKGQETKGLYTSPAQTGAGCRFPFLTVESKSYSSGDGMFEAQNQAAVSGACTKNLLKGFSDFIHRDTYHSLLSEAPVWSICTDGSTLQLWIHYTTMQDGHRFYCSKLYDACQIPIAEQVTRFLINVDKIFVWATSEFLSYIALEVTYLERARRNAAVD
ncbi:hypothetical protein MMC10_003308 [Thelotrema lepadinum]|nr:hypothetical protein [Thelotrema lepadinum]